MTCLPIQSNSDARLERVRFFRVKFLMPQPSYRWCLTFVLVLVSALTPAQQLATLRISGTGIQSIELSAKDIAQMPRLSLDTPEPHHGEMQHYEGVRLSDLLAKAGVPLGDKLRGRAMAMYVLTQASDGYAVVYSVAEVDPATTDNRIIVADRMTGKQLDPKKDHSKSWFPATSGSDVGCAQCAQIHRYPGRKMHGSWKKAVCEDHA